jgi:hypothetical protein
MRAWSRTALGETHLLEQREIVLDMPIVGDAQGDPRHKNNADRDMHEEMGFYDRWGTVAAQLAALVERQA